MSNADFDPLDLAEIAVEADRVNRDISGGGGGFLDNFVKLPNGDGYLMMRFLPRRTGNSLFCATRTHKLADKTYHCPRVLTKTNNGPYWMAAEGGDECPVCQYYRAEWQKSMKLTDEKQRDARQNVLRGIKPVERYYYNVIVRECVNPKTNKLEFNVGPLIYSCGKTVHQKIMTAIVGNAKAGKRPKGDITDPKTGRDFRLVKTTTRGSSGFEYPDYGESEFEEPSPLGTPDELKKWVAVLHDLNKLRTVKEWSVLDHALKVHNGVIAGDEDDFDTSVYEAMSDEPKFPAKPVPQQPKPVVKQEKNGGPPKSKVVEDEDLADPDFIKEMDALDDSE